MANLYVCGNGLAITKFVLQRESGASWEGVSSYQQGKRHRFRARFENSFINSTPVGSGLTAGAYGNTGIHITDLQIFLTLPGATFDGWGQSSAAFALMPGVINGHPNFNETIAPQSTRSFDFGYFTWMSPSKAASSVAVQVYTRHRFIAFNQTPPTGNLLATSS
jgi:hypothetical protein